MLPREPLEMVAQPRPFAVPPTDTEVRVVALREHPAVATRDDAELHPGGPAVRLRVEVAPGGVRLEGDAGDDAVAEPYRARDGPVRSVGSDDERSPYSYAPDGGGHAVAVQRERVHARPVAELRARRRGLLGEVQVEAAPLGHQDQRAGVARPRKTAAVADA